MTTRSGPSTRAGQAAAPPAQSPGPAGAALDYYDPADVAIGANYRLPAGDSQLADDDLDAALSTDAVIGLVRFLGAAEKFTASTDTWNTADYGYRNPLTAAAGYLRFMETTGYTLSPIKAHLAYGKRGRYTPAALRGTSTQLTGTPAEDEP